MFLQVRGHAPRAWLAIGIGLIGAGAFWAFPTASNAAADAGTAPNRRCASGKTPMDSRVLAKADPAAKACPVSQDARDAACRATNVLDAEKSQGWEVEAYVDPFHWGVWNPAKQAGGCKLADCQCQ